MTPRPGGEADKLGNRYEMAWAVRYALYCIVDSTRTLTAEDIDPDLGRGSEFTYVNSGSAEVHQLKRQHGNNNNWSIKALAGLGIFRAAVGHVVAGRRYHFVSLIPCGPLKELSERARKSADLAVFTRSWLTEELRTAFDQLAAEEVLGDAQTAWMTLRGMWFEIHDEDDVVRVNGMLAELSLDGAPGDTVAIAIGAVLLDNLGKRLSRTELLDDLARHGITPRAAGSRISARDRVKEATASWLGTVQRELLQPPIERVEAAELPRVLEADRLALVVGTAGGGKSSVLQQTVDSLRSSGAEVLALRLDRVEPFASTTDLGRQLGFDTSPAVALAIAADGQDAYIVVDQVDAVSLASGRMPQSFDVVMDLIGEALSVPRVRVILACREFDVENDHRIRALAARSDIRTVSIGALTDEQVVAAVTRMGLNPVGLTIAQLSILQTPLHLVLLNSIAAHADPLSFQSKGSLFATFWERKRQAAKARRAGVRFNETLARIASAASDRQVLSVPIEVLDEGDLLDDANVLVSEHILARDGDRIAFFHETFFDYAFSRQWVSRGESLLGFLLRDEQELFRRAQVRQILQHLHEREPDRFLKDLEGLLASEEVRFHIKETALAVFASLPAPTAAESDLALRIADMGPSWEGRLWQQLRRAQWFRRFHEDGQIAGWLDGTDRELQARAINMMAIGANEHGDAVADLLESRQSVSDYLGWMRHVLRVADVDTNRRLFELFLEVVRGCGFETEEGELWLDVHGLARRNPLWAVELLRARLVDHKDALKLDADEKVVALTIREWGANELVRQGAAAEPLAFVETIVPYLLSVMSVTETPPLDQLPIRDRHFRFRLPDRGHHDRSLDQALLEAAVASMEALATSDPMALKPTLDLLAEDPHEAAQYLLYRALIAGEGAFAEWSAKLLLQGMHRLDCGYLSDRRSTAREMVRAIAPHLDDATHHDLEELFRDLRNPYEQSRNFGRTAFAFLTALQESRLSSNGMQRIQEYRRKFKEDAPSAPAGIISGTIESPISDDALTKMSDAHWLNAMAKHKDEHDWVTLKGGARELSNQLRVHVSAEPERFAQLALKTTSDLNPAYGDAFLMGFGDAEPVAEPDVVFAAVRHIASFGHDVNNRWLGMALRQQLRSVPLDLVELILDRCINSRHPEDNAPLFDGNGRERRAESLRMNGINTTRGSLAEALGDLLIYDTDGQRTQLVSGHLEGLAVDSVLSVRTCVAHTVAASLRFDRPSAYGAFARLIETDDIVLATDQVQRLMLYIGNVNPELIEPVIERMLCSADEEAREAGGQLAALAALEWEREDLLTRALHGDAPIRLGAARTCAARVDRTLNPELATLALLELMNDGDDEVRRAAAELAMNLREHSLRPFAKLLEALIDSDAYSDASPQLLITLEQAPDKVDDLVLRVARRFMDLYGQEASDVRTSAAGDAHLVSGLVVRGLAQSRDRVHRAALLDVLDVLLALGVYGIGEAIAQSERP